MAGLWAHPSMGMQTSAKAKATSAAPTVLRAGLILGPPAGVRPIRQILDIYSLRPGSGLLWPGNPAPVSLRRQPSENYTGSSAAKKAETTERRASYVLP